MATQLNFPIARATDANDNPQSGALARLYLAGTSTPVQGYADDDLSVTLPTPIVADAGGLFPQVFVAEVSGVKAVITTATGAALYAFDPVPQSITGASGANGISFSPVVGNTATNVQSAIAANVTAISGKADASRLINTGPGLTGGGSLATDRTLDVALHTTAEAEAGTATGKVMDAKLVKEAILASAATLTGTSGRFRIGLIEVKYGPFSLAAPAASTQAITFTAGTGAGGQGGAFPSTLIGVLFSVSNAASDQIGHASPSAAGFTAVKGASDTGARTGTYFAIGY